MSHAACDAARAVAYVGAGTVEFIADAYGAFYFMEMNTRLQVEHPVTEMITGLDLVEWQLRIAAGERLPRGQSEIRCRGHAIEARIYAEEPEKGFLPSTGRLLLFRTPLISEHVRIDAGVEQGDWVTPHYDPMLAKLIVWDETRESAMQRMLQALAEFHIVGVGNNIAFLARLIKHPAFQQGTVDTTLIERDSEALLLIGAPAAPDVFFAAALWIVSIEQGGGSTGDKRSGDAHSPWSRADGWRLNGTLTRTLEFRDGERSVSVPVRYIPGGYRLDELSATIEARSADALTFTVGSERLTAHIVRLNDELHIFLQGRHAHIAIHNRMALSEREADAHAGLLAPMPGTIIALAVPAGTDVEKGTPLLVMEAMKMEHTLQAPGPGRVLAFHCKVGEQVREGAELVNFEVRD
jgi:3-methylcrotonyl-CoA carboxylase alpha subunit